ncbi:MAG: metallophosphoesterase family protein [Bacteroidia bacterium]|nr:metallophosphoesterase family protein [Bacteroidia bacterium]
MQIALLSDTHGYLDKSILKYLNEVDEIWHAGDVGSESLIDELSKIKPIRAVYGNIDGGKLRVTLKENLLIEIQGIKFLLTHIAGAFEKYSSRVNSLIKEFKPQVLVCGHSHICKVAFDKKNNLLYINPGAAGNHGFHQIKTFIRFSIMEGKITDMNVVELGKRGTLS